jgi:hypothetical protein
MPIGISLALWECWAIVAKKCSTEEIQMPPGMYGIQFTNTISKEIG